jgi:hypothetical protein
VISYEHVDVFLGGSQVGASAGTLLPELSLEGGENSPPETPGANDPGLASKISIGGFSVSKKWMWIIAILAIILGLWYFYGSSATA